jgi:VanZ family protein
MFQVLLWGPVALWALVIFYFSGIPDLRTDLAYDFWLRKAAHVTEYLILVSLLYRAYKRTWPVMGWEGLVVYPSAIAVIYACFDEIHQSFVPGRQCALTDVLIDAGGVALFYIGMMAVSRMRRSA